jgi:hypothetical protein
VVSTQTDNRRKKNSHFLPKKRKKRKTLNKRKKRKKEEVSAKLKGTRTHLCLEKIERGETGERGGERKKNKYSTKKDREY